MIDTSLNINPPFRGQGVRPTLTVIGGGAAGFFCAINAARLNPSLKVTIIEKTGKVLSKVKVSGGGRCNVTHACFDIPELAKHYPRGQNFLKKAFHWFNTKHTIEWFETRGITLKTEADGRMFPVTDDSQTIIDCLIREVNKYSVEIIFHTEIQSITKTATGFQLETGNRKLETDFLCIACGGFPKAAQFSWLMQGGHTIEPPVPSLFTFNIPNNSITDLMGISTPATVKVQQTTLSQTGPVLITHWGLSGPAVLKLSAWGARTLAAKEYNFEIKVNWLPDYNEGSLKILCQRFRQTHARNAIHSKSLFDIPTRLWQHLLLISGVAAETRWADLPSACQVSLIKNLTAQPFQVKGKTTFKEEFVTCGGIKLAEIDPNTMQSKLMPHLFFAGEIMDIDGITGGFNFQSAWTTGFIAAKAIAAL